LRYNKGNKKSNKQYDTLGSPLARGSAEEQRSVR
jgi:hypothetical protein